MIQYRISGISSQWRVGGFLVNNEKDDGNKIPVRGWQYQNDQSGWQDDEDLRIKGKT